MTADKVISIANGIINNSIDDEIKVMWLAEIDGKILRATENTTYTIPDNEWTTYIRNHSENAVSNCEMLLISPYDGMYINYLLYEIYNALGEKYRAESEKVKFDEKYNDFTNYLSRTYARTTNNSFILGAKYSV